MMFSYIDTPALPPVAAKDAPASRPVDDVPRLPYRGHYTRGGCRERLDWLRAQTGAVLEAVGDYAVDPQGLEGNIENFIGMAQVPIGVAGPLQMEGDHARGYVYAPFATTEGALVASATRGARALSLAGGVRARVVHQQMVRAPLFVLDTVDAAFQLKAWVEAHVEALRDQVRQASRHAELVALQPFVVGNTLHVRFVYRTGDAAGQNMTTCCTWKACQWMLEQVDLPVRHFAVEANLSSDKKVSYLNYLEGRGLRVTAEAFLPEAVLQDVLKVSSAQLVETVHAFMAGSLQAGTVGFNINIANTIAALFTATGQDIACVHESSVGQLDVRPAAGGVYASLLLPSLLVGTVGGGTALPTQRECLELMGCYGTGRVARLAEIIAGFCLALDLSTLAAITGGQFVAAHERLGRNRPEDGLKEEDLTPRFFETALRPEGGHGEDGAVHVCAAEAVDLDTSSSILSSLTSTALRKKVGHSAYRIRYREGGAEKEVKVVVKVKPTDTEVVNLLTRMARGCGGRLAAQYDAFKFSTGFRKCHVRELAVSMIRDPRFTAVAPVFYHSWQDDAREIYVLVMEHLEGVTHLGTESRIALWREEHVRAVLRDLAVFHSLYYARTEALERSTWIDLRSAARMEEMMPLWEALVEHHEREFPQLYTPARAACARRIVEQIPSFWPQLEQAPRTLIHNDFNLRNLCLRPAPAGFRLCAYDWELATVHVPQHDVAEFLAFVLPPETPPAERLRYVDFYRRTLEQAVSTELDTAAFVETFNLACLDLLVNRFALYTMAHTFKDYTFLPRVLDGHFRYVQALL